MGYAPCLSRLSAQPPHYNSSLYSPIFGAVKYRLLLFFSGLSLLAVLLWRQLFHVPFLLVPYHLAVVIPLHILALGSIALVHVRFHSTLFTVLKVGAWLLLTVFFYLLIFGSMQLWGDIITLSILSTYFRDLGGFLHSLPFAYGQLVAASVLFLLLPFLLVYLFRRQVGLALDHYAAAIRSHSKLLLLAGGILLLASPLLLRAKRIVHKQGEPLMVMLFDHMWGVTDNPLFSPRRIQVGFRDKAERTGYTGTATPTKNVILIIVDALRADHLSAYGYGRRTSPFLDGLISSHRAARVQRCYSTCACTLCGVPSILLSRTWPDCAVNGFNLVGLLHDQGYSTYALISGAHQEWYNMAKFYSDDCTMYFDGKQSTHYYFKDDRVLLEGLDRVADYSGKPAFFYLHLQSTHETGLLQDKYTPYGPFKKSITATNLNTQAALNEYDNKVVQADDMIRQLYQALDRKGYLRNSIVLITSDHGQGLGEHGVSGHVDWLYDPQVSVPLIIADDSLSLYHNLTLARHIDIAPTIIDRLGLPRPQSWMGLSLLQPTIAPYSYHETGQTNLETGKAKYMTLYYQDSSGAVSTLPFGEGRGGVAIYKYIYTAGYREEELYELISDPAELHNIAATNKDMIEKMRRK